jgi:hypothetical protein
LRLSAWPLPSSEEIRSLRVHELLRDYPEVLAFLEDRGIDPRRDGGKTLAQLLPPDELWLPELMSELRWRGNPAS